MTKVLVMQSWIRNKNRSPIEVPPNYCTDRTHIQQEGTLDKASHSAHKAHQLLWEGATCAHAGRSRGVPTETTSVLVTVK